MYSSNHALPQSSDHKRSRPYETGTEYVGFWPTGQALRAPSANRGKGWGGGDVLIS